MVFPAQNMLVCAFISNCGARNNRLDVLKELMQYVEVKSFGGCLHNAVRVCVCMCVCACVCVCE